jgi:hypothetical protein
MKKYPNLVLKYAPRKAAAKYKAIEAKNDAEYNEAQLSDLMRFLKDDLKSPVNKDNQIHMDKRVASQRKEIEQEIVRLKGQLGL